MFPPKHYSDFFHVLFLNESFAKVLNNLDLTILQLEFLDRQRKKDEYVKTNNIISENCCLSFSS